MEVWTTEDARKGLCELEDVGEERPTERIPEPEPEPNQEQSPESDQDELLSDDMFDHEFAEYLRNKSEYKARNPPALVVKLLATCEERRTRAAVKPAYAVDHLSDKMIAKMSTDDLKKFVLHRTLAGMTEEEQAAALAGLEPK